ncbi:MAG: hypothetical protein NC041_01620 [Bacteroides sp.]|nr:hypothetical protein [Prevotella sp.]MCM1407698.1 hypothetical protein [Treponema brennaborense]MCM1469152.1 hypothetical protein [Bacteroides sp.]
MASHLFNLDRGRELTTMGASWFVSYKYHELIDKTHNNWAKVEKTLENRISVYGKSDKYHKYWLKEVLKMDDRNLNKNKLELEADEIKRMAKEVLAVMNK